MLRKGIFLLLTIAFMSSTTVMAATTDKGDRTAKVEVTGEEIVGSIDIQIQSWRKIGEITISVRDAKGKVFYLENGKAMTAEFTRRLDKRTLPKGELRIEINSRDLNITRVVENR